MGKDHNGDGIKLKCTVRLSTNDARKIGHPYEKNNPWPIPHTTLKFIMKYQVL